MSNDTLELVSADILRGGNNARQKEDVVFIKAIFNGVAQFVMISKQHVYDSIIGAKIKQSLDRAGVKLAIKDNQDHA